jgi:hypothetical protein
MKPPYAHASRTALAVVAAAGTIWLAAFFLPGAVVGPIPVLPAIGGAAGKVVAVHEPAARKRPAAHTQKATPAVARTELATVTFQPHVRHVRTAARIAVKQPRRVRHHARHHAARPKHSAPAPRSVPASAPASPPARSFDSAAPPGRAIGWHRKHDQAAAPAAVAPGHGHGQGHGQGNGHGHAASDEPAAQPAQTAAAPIAPPSAGTNGHDNGRHLGDEHDHGDQGNGPGGKK